LSSSVRFVPFKLHRVLIRLLLHHRGHGGDNSSIAAAIGSIPACFVRRAIRQAPCSPSQPITGSPLSAKRRMSVNGDARAAQLPSLPSPLPVFLFSRHFVCFSTHSYSQPLVATRPLLTIYCSPSPLSDSELLQRLVHISSCLHALPCFLSPSRVSREVVKRMISTLVRLLKHYNDS
jgi:hypothetical protein